MVKGQNIGQIDIDSHTYAAFDKSDAEFLTKVNTLVATYLF